jgi:hypothetical protein
MEKCSWSCPDVCDFCENYDFNPGPEGEYLNNGFCRLLKVKKDPHNGCENFKCFRIELLNKEKLK